VPNLNAPGHLARKVKVVMQEVWGEKIDNSDGRVWNT
jgi:hypothetical protein